MSEINYSFSEILGEIFVEFPLVGGKEGEGNREGSLKLSLTFLLPEYIMLVGRLCFILFYFRPFLV